MISIDSNVLITLWDVDDPMRQTAATALERLRDEDTLCVCGFVYGELMGASRGEQELDRFFHQMGIVVDWDVDEAMLRVAGRAFGMYNERRRAKHGEESRRLLTDFLIGAHAQVNGIAMLTRDKRLFRAAFPHLALLRL